MGSRVVSFALCSDRCWSGQEVRSLRLFFFFFKQKTAYEMRISDWSSDVCSSDLLLEVSRLGPKTFEQCAGFLRISGGGEPLDASSVHPEAYGLAAKIVAACGRDLRTLMGDSKTLRELDPRKFVDEHFGLPTVRDILEIGRAHV